MSKQDDSYFTSSSGINAQDEIKSYQKYLSCKSNESGYFCDVHEKETSQSKPKNLDCCKQTEKNNGMFKLLDLNSTSSKIINECEMYDSSNKCDLSDLPKFPSTEFIFSKNETKLSCNSQNYGIINRDSSTSYFSCNEANICDNNNKLSNFEYIIGNTVYENWNNVNKEKTSSVDSSFISLISEFDPLYDTVISDTDNISLSDIDLFCHETKDFNILNNNATNNHSNTLNNVVNNVKKQKSSESKIGWHNVRRALQVISNSSHRSPKAVKKSDCFFEKNGSDSKTESILLSKPGISSFLVACLHNGVLYKASPVEKTDFVQRWCQLSEGKLYYSSNKNNIKEFIDLDVVSSISFVQDHKLNNVGDNLYCFEISMLTKSNKYLFGAKCSSERCIWMQKILENLTSVFPTRFSLNYLKAGWCFLKESINGSWSACWILLQKRTLIYTIEGFDEKFKEVDLRKARFIDLQAGSSANLNGNYKQVILLDTVSLSLYIVMSNANENVEWFRSIKAAATENSMSLEDQQLTKDNIPVIVDKCINFVYAYGSMSEGIYRRSGSNSNVTKLLSLFRQDSWCVQLSRQEYSEYDVANVLKRFFRDLSEPLITSQAYKEFCDICEFSKDKLPMYRHLLEQLSLVNFVTIRKLMGHLHFIHEQREKNLMPVENLAAIWGPTLMHTENKDFSLWSKLECQVVHDLILLYPELFLVDNEEEKRENKIREVLELYHNSAVSIPQVFKPSGDLKIWIYLKSRDSGEYVNVTVDPNKCCETVCEELATRFNNEPYCLCLQEVVSNEQFIRPMHYKERILDIVLRWGYWDEIDRKNNYLLLTSNNIIKDVYTLIKPSLTVYCELKYADRKMKNFKNYYFEFTDTSLCYYKDKKKNSVKIEEWKIKDIVWYLGYESKRNPRTRWAITFIVKKEKQNRCKNYPYFGYTIAGNNKEEQFLLIAAMLVAQYSHEDLLPPVTLSK